MPLFVAIWVIRCVAAYAIVGLVFACVFVTIGVQRIDPHARESGWGFRALILPGSVLLWPLLAHRWASRVAEPPIETNAHRVAARDGRAAGPTP